MSSWIVTGQASDFTSDIEDLVEALLDDSDNWVETDPAYASVKFGNDTWDGNKDYQVHVTRGRYTREPQNNAWNMYRYHHDVEVHVFCRRVVENKPDQWGKMERQIEKIISQNKTAFGQGITVGSISGFEVPANDSNLKTRWHSMMTVSLLYHKVDTS